MYIGKYITRDLVYGEVRLIICKYIGKYITRDLVYGLRLRIGG